MERPSQDPKIQRLLVDALASYSDACTLPLLTPGCPYYREDPYPTCGEECREVLSAEGFGRSVRTVTVDGLRMTGREMPLSAAGPTHVWDPVRALFEQRELPADQQSTSTLLLRLWVTFLRSPDSEAGTGVATALSIVAELDRRGIPVDRVIRAALIPQMAGQVSFKVLALAMYDEDELAHLEDAAPWLALAENYVASRPQAGSTFEFSDTPDEMSNVVRGLGFLRVFERMVAVEIEESDFKEVEDFGDRVRGALTGTSVAAFAMSPGFLHRVQHWLESRFAHGVAALLNAEAPASAVFNALPSRPPTPDPLGSWVWDRFTTVAVEEWETDSLVWEWGHARGARSELPTQAINERTLDEGELTELIIDRLTLHAVKAPPSRTLKPEEFVGAAVAKLNAGEPDKAAAIFEALVDLDPTNADARNNLGFCLLPTEPARALEVLEAASRGRLSNPALCKLNRALALSVAERHDEAITLLDQTDEHALVGAHGAFLWRPVISPTGEYELALEHQHDAVAYARELRTHIDTLKTSLLVESSPLADPVGGFVDEV